MKWIFILLGHLTFLVLSNPQNLVTTSEAPNSTSLLKITKNGKREIGLDLLGFHVNVGLKPFVATDGIGGTIHAEAGTPFGQCAEAGVQGQVGAIRTVGSAYAQATAGQRIAAAAAGVEGAVGPKIGATGAMYAEAFKGNESNGIVTGNPTNGGTLTSLQGWMQNQSLINDNEEDEVDEMLTTIQQWIQNHTLTDDEVDEEFNSGTRYVAHDMPLLSPSRNEDSSSTEKNKVQGPPILSVLSHWMQNKNPNVEKNKDSFSKTKNNHSKKKTKKDSKRTTSAPKRKTSPTSITEVTTKKGIFSFFRNWMPKNSFADDSRSKFIDSDNHNSQDDFSKKRRQAFT